MLNVKTSVWMWDWWKLGFKTKTMNLNLLKPSYRAVGWLLYSCHVTIPADSVLKVIHMSSILRHRHSLTHGNWNMLQRHWLPDSVQGIGPDRKNNISEQLQAVVPYF